MNRKGDDLCLIVCDLTWSVEKLFETLGNVCVLVKIFVTKYGNEIKSEWSDRYPVSLY